MLVTPLAATPLIKLPALVGVAQFMVEIAPATTFRLMVHVTPPSVSSKLATPVEVGFPVIANVILPASNANTPDGMVAVKPNTPVDGMDT